MDTEAVCELRVDQVHMQKVMRKNIVRKAQIGKLSPQNSKTGDFETLGEKLNNLAGTKS